MSLGDTGFNATKNIEGQLLTLVDATFQDPEQRKAQKDMIRKIVWGWNQEWVNQDTLEHNRATNNYGDATANVEQ